MRSSSLDDEVAEPVPICTFPPVGRFDQLAVDRYRRFAAASSGGPAFRPARSMVRESLLSGGREAVLTSRMEVCFCSTRRPIDDCRAAMLAHGLAYAGTGVTISA
jgi:hypothetical protein